MSSCAFLNGNIHTLSGGRVVEALYVENGVIRAAGATADVAPLCQNQVDLRGRTVIPGFHESHLHMLSCGAAINSLDLRGCTTAEAVVRAGREKALRERPERLWLTGYVSPYAFTRGLLDQVSEEIPVFYSRISGHTFSPHVSILSKVCCNTAALRLAGLPLDGCLLRGGAVEPVFPLLPRLSRAEKKEALATAAALLAARGFTSVHSNDMEDGDMDILESLRELEAEGRLPLRVSMQCLFRTAEDLSAFLARDPRPGFDSDKHRVGAVKLVLDGVLGDRTSAMERPYADDPENRGLLQYTPESLRAIIETAHLAGLPVVIHTIGDRAIGMAIDAFAEVLGRLGKGPRHGLIHCLFLTREQLRRMAELDLSVMIQPYSAVADYPLFRDRLEHLPQRPMYGWKSMLEAGLLVAGGTDCPCDPPDPFLAMQGALTRQDASGAPEGGFLPEERLTLDEALRVMTVNGAGLDRTEDRLGVLEPGRLADFVVLSRDIFAAAPEQLTDTRCLATVVGGQFVHLAEEGF